MNLVAVRDVIGQAVEDRNLLLCNKCNIQDEDLSTLSEDREGLIHIFRTKMVYCCLAVYTPHLSIQRDKILVASATKLSLRQAQHR